MTAARLTKRRTVLERHRAEVISLVMEGRTDAQVARFYQVSREAVSRFRERHADELTAIQLKVDQQIEDYAIAQKVNRIAAKDFRWRLLEEVRRQRSQDGTGIDTGLVVRQYKALGSGKNMQIVEEFKVDDGLLAALERAEHGAAEELAQLPRPDVNVQNNIILIRQVIGIGDDIPLG